MKSMDVQNIRLGGELGRRVNITCANNLLVVDLARDFLLPFQEKKAGEGFIGLGAFIDAIARLAKYSGDPALISCKKDVVRKTIQTQEDDGYIGIFPPDKRFSGLWDIHEKAFLINGLATDYRLWGEKDPLAAASRLADWLIRRWTAATDFDPEARYVMATLEIENALISLYEQTQDRQYLDFCTKFRRLQEWDRPIVQGRWNRIEGHAYDYLCRCLAQLQLSRWQPEYRLFQAMQRALDFMLNQNGMVITGEVGDHECWHSSQDGTVNLGETCTTAYLIRMMHVLLQQTGNSLYGDIMERALYNALFAAQSPDGRRIRYYTPFEGPRSYFGSDTYCCPGNFRRIAGELPEMAFYLSDNGILVNLYTSCTAHVAIDGVSMTLQQETDYPHSGEVHLMIDPASSIEFNLRLRIPRWCLQTHVEVNGKPVPGQALPGSFFSIHRLWKPGDHVSLSFAMPFRLVRGREAQAGRVAIMRGPVVFCLNRAGNTELAGKDLRSLVIDPGSLEGPIEDNTVHKGGMACRLRAWWANEWYPDAQPALALTLTEFEDPGGEAIYFKIPVPNDTRIVDDELFAARTRLLI